MASTIRTTPWIRNLTRLFTDAEVTPGLKLLLGQLCLKPTGFMLPVPCWIFPNGTQDGGASPVQGENSARNNISVILTAMNVGELIRQARLSRGWTQIELARRLGTPQPAITRWERGALSPRIDTLERILKACGFQAELQLTDQWQVDPPSTRDS